ncbi:hypothetical protein GCM10010261_03660 [Streptomyces pilosus]|uniref:Uncharacterized protein n=1 Tax=Streptomyces pilosus TaxID=28893 RepID=A0A918BFC2_9ACTN|nr:hypothetical protein GCM10010280_07880 [Streptomyces pilosus]GGV34817.1 hypothetical protein GCM10010261_03660 [Streptomyces pilosus]
MTGEPEAAALGVAQSDALHRGCGRRAFGLSLAQWIFSSLHGDAGRASLSSVRPYDYPGVPVRERGSWSSSEYVRAGTPVPGGPGSVPGPRCREPGPGHRPVGR